MHVNRPSAFSSNHLNEKDHANEVGAANSAAASSCIGSTTSSRGNLRRRVTPRTEDYLQRLRVHGNPTQRSLAISTCDALERDRFIPNPSRDKPVVQFGVSITSDDKKGVLLANFMPHDDKLELEALAFRAERFFETEAGSIEKVVLRHAQEFPEVGAAEHLIGSAAHARLPDLRQRSQGDTAYEMKALKKDVKRFDKQTMHRKMASKLADMRVNDGRSSSRMTALPIAHATVASARLRQLAIAPFQHMLAKRDALEAKLPSIHTDAAIPSAFGIPSGLQYEFSKAEFAKFYEEHWIPADHAKRTAAPEKNRSVSLEETTHTQDADSTPRLERRNRQLMGNNLRTELQIRLDQSSLSSSEQAEATPDAEFAARQDRRDGLLMDKNMKTELQKLLDNDIQ